MKAMPHAAAFAALILASPLSAQPLSCAVPE